MKKLLILSIPLFLTLIPSYFCLSAQDAYPEQELRGTELFLSLFEENSNSKQDFLLNKIADTWKPEYAILALESNYLIGDFSLSIDLYKLLKKKTGKDFGTDYDKWYQWIWNQEELIPQDYADFKAEIYKGIDSRFETYFKGRQTASTIRLDEVRWGGVKQDGIPPLRNPSMIQGEKANYLQDDNIVFGIEVNGDARAYPKRILAWHEMFVDHVGGVAVAGVYCTLCGTVILYKTEHKGIQHSLGTSGFLYRSNKLMYDKATQSLWNTLQGRPVIGPLADKGIKLAYMSVVTTTWGEWKKRHPETQVLSLKTGHRRNYGEGVAYQEYFATDELMFSTPFRDKRLKNKQEILALRLPEYPNEQVAISTKFLKKHPIHIEKIGDQKLLILTDKSGANRVYDPEGLNFARYDQDIQVIDTSGEKWVLYENKLISSEGRVLTGIPAHRAFWFAWVSAFPNTRLVK